MAQTSVFLVGTVVTISVSDPKPPSTALSVLCPPPSPRHTQLSGSHSSKPPWGMDEEAPYKCPVIKASLCEDSASASQSLLGLALCISKEPKETLGVILGWGLK